MPLFPVKFCSLVHELMSYGLRRVKLSTHHPKAFTFILLVDGRDCVDEDSSTAVETHAAILPGMACATLEKESCHLPHSAHDLGDS